MNFDKEANSDKKKIGERGGGGGGAALKPKQQTVSNEVNTKMQLSTQCRACGTINISKYVNIFLSTNPTTFILSSLVSEFFLRSKMSNAVKYNKATNYTLYSMWYNQHFKIC